MTPNQQPHLAAAPAPLLDDQTSRAQPEVCPSCGGSGMLRLGDQRFRTCLDCLGQGRLSAVAAATTVAEVFQLDSRRLNAAASSAAAR
jgi:DnaJ-class molecular chaperone